MDIINEGNIHLKYVLLKYFIFRLKVYYQMTH